MLKDLVGNIRYLLNDICAADSLFCVASLLGIAGKHRSLFTDAQKNRLDALLVQGIHLPLQPLGRALLQPVKGAVRQHNEPALPLLRHRAELLRSLFNRGIGGAAEGGVHLMHRLHTALVFSGDGQRNISSAAELIDGHGVVFAQHGGKDLHGIFSLTPARQAVHAHTAGVIIDDVNGLACALLRGVRGQHKSTDTKE